MAIVGCGGKWSPRRPSRPGMKSGAFTLATARARRHIIAMGREMLMRWRRLLVVLVIAAALLPAAGCGRKSAPEPPPGADYPRTYPSR